MPRALRSLPLAALTALLLATSAHAAEIVVTNIDSPSPLPAGTNWSTIATENTGTADITTSQPRSGNGSIELTGDRTRVQTGFQYSAAAGGTSNMGLLSNVVSLTFDWMVANDSINALGSNYTPALRLLVQDGATRSELIWEGAYNGVTVTRDQWATSGAFDNFWRFAGGTTFDGNGAQINQSIAAWSGSSYYSANAFVSGISVGAGGSAGAGYHGFVDNVTYATSVSDQPSSVTYNFEVAQAVPEPATWAFMIIGFGAVGASLRSARRRPGAALTA